MTHTLMVQLLGASYHLYQSVDSGARVYAANSHTVTVDSGAESESTRITLVYNGWDDDNDVRGRMLTASNTPDTATDSDRVIIYVYSCNHGDTLYDRQRILDEQLSAIVRVHPDIPVYGVEEVYDVSDNLCKQSDDDRAVRHMRTQHGHMYFSVEICTPETADVILRYIANTVNQRRCVTPVSSTAHVCTDPDSGGTRCTIL